MSGIGSDAAHVNLMEKGAYAFIAANRDRFALTQRELARLLGLSTGGAVSRIERSNRVPKTQTFIACSIVFGIGTAELFPSLYEEIEEAIITTAKILLDETEGKNDKDSELKRAFLKDILSRIISRNESKNV